MIVCEKCGKKYNTDVTPLHCRCGMVTVVAVNEPPSPNPWNAIHQRLADAINQPWDAAAEQAWYTSKWLPTVPSYGCKCKEHWGALTAKHPIDWTTAESAFESVWHLHNEVSRLHSHRPTISLEQCRALWMGPKVAFIAVNYANLGGAETFHQTLLPRLRHYRNIIGFGAIFCSGDPNALGVPYVQGREAITKLCGNADVVVTWGIDFLTELLPTPRPKVIVVHHGDLEAGWIGETMWQKEVDEFAFVNKAAADHVKAIRNLPVHWIPNAVDPERIKPTAKAAEIRASVPAGTKVVLFGHRFSDEKQPTKAVEIAKHLPPDWLLVMAGDGPQKSRAEAMAEGMGNIRFVGRLETLADWLAVADVFLSLSTFEGFGLSMAEALACGVPLVASPVGIAPGFATTLVDAKAGAEEWARAIVEAYGAETDSKKAIEAFGVESHVRQWAGIF